MLMVSSSFIFNGVKRTELLGSGFCRGLTSVGCDVSLLCLDAVPLQLSNVPYQVMSYLRELQTCP